MNGAMVSPKLIDDIVALLGERACLADPAAQARYLVDWRELFRGRTALVVRPGSTDEVAGVMRLCAAAGVPIVPQGGNTGLVGGGVPSASGTEIVLSLERMSRIREIDKDNHTATVEAGCILQSVQEAVAEHGRFFPLSLGAQSACQIGGNIATNAGGNAVLRYGNMRDLTLGLEVVLPDGSILHGLKGLRKSNTGLDLKQLFIGSEGTLGIITAATLKLFPSPGEVETGFVAVDCLERLMELFSRARAGCDEFLSAFEFISEAGLDMALEYVPGLRDPLSRRHPHYALIELSTSHGVGGLNAVFEGFLEAAVADGIVTDGVIAKTRQEAGELWRIREACVEAQRLAGPSIKHDVSVPISAIPHFIRKASKAVARLDPALRVIAFGHVGDGNVHFNICPAPGREVDALVKLEERITSIVYDVAMGLNGSFSAEHGIGALRRDALQDYLPDVDLRLMRAVKETLDPDGLLNPGKVIDGRRNARPRSSEKPGTA